MASNWTNLGLGGFGNMTTPAMSPLDGSTPAMLVNCDMGGAYFSRDGGKNWTLLHYKVLEGNAVCKPAFHPDYPNTDTIFAASEFGVLKKGEKLKTPALTKWTPLNTGFRDDRPLGEIAIDPAQPKLMLVSTSEDSNFSGNHFIDISKCTGVSVNKFASRIYRSQDGGEHWSEVFLSGELGFILGFHFDQRDAATLTTRRCYAAAQRGILVSDDGGQAWQPLDTTGLPFGDANHLRGFAGGSRNDPETGPELRLYALFRNRGLDNGCGIFRKIGDGPWEHVEIEGIAGASPDAELSDSQCSFVQFQHVLTSNESPQLVYAFHSNTDFFPPFHAGVYRSTNGGDSWKQVFYPRRDKNYPDPRPEYDCNVELNWETAVRPIGPFEPGNGVATCPGDPGRLLVVGTRAYVRDGENEKWRCADSPPPATFPVGNAPIAWPPNGLSVTAAWDYVIDPHDSNRHFICNTDIGFSRSLDRGATWIWGNRKEHPSWDNSVYQILIDPAQPNRMWAAFSSLHDIPNGNVILRFQKPRPNDPPHEGRVGFSADHGVNWTLLDDSTLPNAPVTCLARGPNDDLFAGVWERGVYVKKANSSQWQSLGLELEPEFAQLNGPKPRVWRMHLHADGTLFVLTTAQTTFDQNDKVEFHAAGVGLYRFEPAQNRWTRLGAKGFEDDNAKRFHWPRDFAVDPADSKIVYVANSEPVTVVKKDEHGALLPPDEAGVFQLRMDSDTWKRLPLEEFVPESRVLKLEYRFYGVYLHPTRPTWIYITLNEQPGRTNRRTAGLWLSKDRGESFQPFAAFEKLPFKNIHKVVIDPDDDDTLYVCTNGAGVWRGPADPAQET